jgi:N-acetyl-anhydromuramyl-L-alanine amidase AmpD
VTTRLFVDEFSIDVTQWLAGHKEYAPTRKIDPESFDLDAWRERAAQPYSPPVTPVWDVLGFVLGAV